MKILTEEADLDELSFILQSNSYFGYSEKTLNVLYCTAKKAYTYLRYLDIILSIESKYIKDSFVPIVLSLQESFYINLFKLIDTGKSSKTYNMQTFINYLDKQTTQKPLHFWNSLYSSYMNSDLLKSIRLRRNKVFAHNLGEDAQVIFNTSKVDLIQLKEFLIFCIKLTYPNYTILPAVVTTDITNIGSFERLINNLIKEVTL
jgi:hypothetical protein